MIIETKRFLLRQVDYKDVDDFFELDSNPEVHMFIGKRPIETKSDAQHIIDYILDQYDKYGFGRLAIEDKTSGECVGWSGIKYETQIRETPYHDIGYRIKQKHWGKGIASEAAKASIKYGFNHLGLHEICAAADVDNHASNRVLDKIGMNKIDSFIFDGSEHNWYVIHAESFE